MRRTALSSDRTAGPSTTPSEALARVNAFSQPRKKRADTSSKSFSLTPPPAHHSPQPLASRKRFGSRSFILSAIETSKKAKRGWTLLLDVLGVSVAVLFVVALANTLIDDLREAEWWLAAVDAAVALGVLILIFLTARRRGEPGRLSE